MTEEDLPTQYKKALNNKTRAYSKTYKMDTIFETHTRHTRHEDGSLRTDRGPLAPFDEVFLKMYAELAVFVYMDELLTSVRDQDTGFVIDESKPKIVHEISQNYDMYVNNLIEGNGPNLRMTLGTQKFAKGADPLEYRKLSQWILNTYVPSVKTTEDFVDELDQLFEDWGSKSSGGSKGYKKI